MRNVMKLTADELATVLNTIEATAIVQTLKETPDADVAKTINSINWPGVFSVLFEMFDNGLSAMGIEIAEEIEAVDEETDDFGLPMDYWSEYDKDENEDEDDEEEADPIEKMLFIYDGKVTISKKNAMKIVRQMTEMIEERGKGLSDAQKTKWLHNALTALEKDYGIEGVLDV